MEWFFFKLCISVAIRRHWKERQSFMAMEMCDLDALEMIPSWMVMQILYYSPSYPNPICLNHVVYLANYADIRQHVDDQMFRLHRLAYCPIDLSDRQEHCIVPIEIGHNPSVLQTLPNVEQYDHRNRIVWYPFQIICVDAMLLHHHLPPKIVDSQWIDLSFHIDDVADPFYGWHVWDYRTDGN